MVLHKYIIWKLWLVMLLILQLAIGQLSKRILCYYANWSEERNHNYRLYPEDIDPHLCTHIVYAFAMPDLSEGIVPVDFLVNLSDGGADEFLKLKRLNPDLHFMLSVGGWDEGSIRFSRIVSDPEKRKWFAEYATHAVRGIGFDGMDLNWQWPGFREGSNAADKDNFVLFLSEIKRYAEYEGKLTNRSRIQLSVVLPPIRAMTLRGFNLEGILREIDFLNLLTMEYHSSTEPLVNHPAPLFHQEKPIFNPELTVEATVDMYIGMGIEASKMNLGIPLYGHSYQLENPVYTEIGSLAEDEGTEGFGTRSPGILAYYEICKYVNVDGWLVERPNKTAMGPYAFQDKNWVAYDDAEMVRRKVRYAKKKGLGGVMLWTIDQDDFKGSCNVSFPLTRAARETLVENDEPLADPPENTSMKIQPNRGSINSQPDLSSQSQGSISDNNFITGVLLGADIENSVSQRKGNNTTNNLNPENSWLSNRDAPSGRRKVKPIISNSTSKFHSNEDSPSTAMHLHQSFPQYTVSTSDSQLKPHQFFPDIWRHSRIKANQSFIYKRMYINFNKNNYYDNK